MRVYSVIYIHEPWVGHGFETLECFSTEALATAYRDHCIAQLDGQIGGFDKQEGYAVDEWIVDDPRVLAAIAPTAPPSTGDGTEGGTR